MKTYTGILDGVAFPDRISGHVVEPARDPRIHGFAVQEELGHQADFTGVMWLALTGELPSTLEAEAFTRALVWLAPLHVGDGPAHAPVLAKVAGAPEEVLPAVSAVALGQHATAELDALAPMFRWLVSGAGAPPEIVVEVDPTPGQRAGWERLCVDVARWFGAARGLERRRPWRRGPAAYALLHWLGIRDRPRLLAIATLARLPVALAEAACVAAGSVQAYPTLQPGYLYVEED